MARRGGAVNKKYTPLIPTFREAEDLSEFKVSLVYTVSFWPIRNAQ